MSENVNTAILEVMRQVGYVQKERKQGLNYSFAGEAALIAALRPAMVQAGLIMSIASYAIALSENYQTKHGTHMNRVIVDAIVRFTHAESDTHRTSRRCGNGRRRRCWRQGAEQSHDWRLQIRSAPDLSDRDWR